MTRVPLVPPDDPTHDVVVAKVFAQFAKENRKPIAIHRALAHNPSLLRAYSGLALSLRYEATTPRALRELVILQTARCIGSAYEWSHHRLMAQNAGVEPEQIAQLRSWRRSERFDAREQAALRCAEEMHDHALSDEAFVQLSAHFKLDQVLEIIVTCAFYQAVARVIQALGLEVEPDYEPYLLGLNGK